MSNNNYNLELVDWINTLIREDRLTEFYTSRLWRKTRLISFEKNNFECQECKRKGRLTLLLKPGEVNANKCKGIGHHKKPLKLYPELALDPDNVEPVCWACHNEVEKTNNNNILTEECW